MHSNASPRHCIESAVETAMARESLTNGFRLSTLVGRIPPRALGAVASLFVVLWLIAVNDKINPDGTLYIDTAKHFLAGEYKEAYRLYPWPFFPALIALLSSALQIDPESAALTLNAGFSVLLTLATVSIAEALGANRRISLLTIFVVLSLPYLNQKRADIVRDLGYWTLVMSSAWIFIRYYRRPSWSRAIGWVITAAIAVLFRIEGIASLFLLPLTLLFEDRWDWRERLRHIARLYAPIGALAILLLVVVAHSGFQSDLPGRLGEPLVRLQALWSEISGGFQAKAEGFRSKVLEPAAGAYAKHTSENARLMLLSSLVGLVVVKIVATLTPIYALLFFLPNLRRVEPWPREAIRTLFGLATINLLVVGVFVVQSYYLSSRFVVPVILPLLPFVAFRLDVIYRHWKEGSPHKGMGRLGYVLLAGTLAVMTVSGLYSFSPSKSYLREAGTWISQNISPDKKLFTNAPIVDYYRGKRISWEKPRAYSVPPPLPIDQYDYVALEQRRGRPPESWNRISDGVPLERLAEFSNRRGDGVVIFAVRVSDGR